MTCKDVLTLLDRLPLAEWPSRQVEEARRHATECSKCRPALAAAEVLDVELRRLPEPAAEMGLAPVVLRSIERREEARAHARIETERVAPSRSGKPWLAWAAASVGAVIGLATQAYWWITGEAIFGPTLPLLVEKPRALLQMPSPAPVLVAMAAGVLLYLAGLFTSVRARSALERWASRADRRTTEPR